MCVALHETGRPPHIGERVHEVMPEAKTTVGLEMLIFATANSAAERTGPAL